jgi:hypothetical protein
MKPFRVPKHIVNTWLYKRYKTNNYTALIKNGSLHLGIEVTAESREEAKRLVQQEAMRLYGYKQLRFSR